MIIIISHEFVKILGNFIDVAKVVEVERSIVELQTQAELCLGIACRRWLLGLGLRRQSYSIRHHMGHETHFESLG